MFCNDYQITSQFRISETTFWYLPRRCLPFGLSLPLSFVSISGTNQFPTIQGRKITTHFELPFLGLIQGLFSGHLVFLLFPFPPLFLLCPPLFLCLPRFLLLHLLFFLDALTGRH